MKSVKSKLLLPIYVLVAFFVLLMGLQLITVRKDLGLVKEMERIHFNTVLKSNELKLGVVQVQQWLTDISATRAAEGYDDGLEEAAIYADHVRDLIRELKLIAPADSSSLDSISQSFEPYYATGVEMANAYIKMGPEGGNQMMESFDAVAEDINSKVDSFMEKATENIAASILNIEKSIQISTVLALFSFVVCIVVYFFSKNIIVRQIMEPILEIKDAAMELSNGNLATKLNYNSADEIGQLTDSMRKTSKTLDEYISDIGSCMKKMEDGDLTAQLSADFRGDFVPLKDSIVKFSDRINRAMVQINNSSNEVAGGSQQVSIGAQSLAQGAIEQAQSVEELSTVLTRVSDQIKSNANTADQANSLADQVGVEAKYSNQHMQEMMAAMAEISSSSAEINKIIKTIEDIAFQTNILALNAAVEAARAGNAGKGFAVVADEVRNLASKSAQAASQTTNLIENSIKAVENGSTIAGTTAQALSQMTAGINQVVDTIGVISDASRQQAKMMEEVSHGVDQISGVVQTVSATAGQSEASSEELSAQSQLLKDLVAKFHLRME